MEKRPKQIDIRKVLHLPWAFWMVICYGLFTTATIVILNGDSTESAEQKFSQIGQGRMVYSVGQGRRFHPYSQTGDSDRYR